MHLPTLLSLTIPLTSLTTARYLDTPQVYNAGFTTADTHPCTDVHIIAARGTVEEYPGRQHRVIRAICNGLPNHLSCDYEDIKTRATWHEWCAGIEEGIEYGKKRITEYVERCPNSAIVLTGFSVGTEIIGDILGGGGGRFFENPGKHGGLGGNCKRPYIAGLSPVGKPAENIVAALLWGDVRHTANQTYNIGSGSHLDGMWPRDPQNLADLNRFSDVLGSFCHVDDPWCASGLIPARHVDYLRVNSEEAAQLVREKLALKMPWKLQMVRGVANV
ncbi:alpha/beta-hydrolase [Ascobolus immersus RN42]|uniref:Alpha/beta-hydrolase n=1 Tax=Ascobolus immersus RN42 TaxID=1160509 RepID=A0A3N4ILG9_ASCIM|nr:alpha/beta-hydrolase [Ascobolus immersus RN42]